MKRFVAGFAVAVVLLMVSAGREAGPAGEPLPIEAKPVLTATKNAVWTIRNDTGTHVVAYYQKVKMPDGTTQELKSRTPLDAKQWQVLAQKCWDAQVGAELNKPKPCPYCGGTGVEP